MSKLTLRGDALKVAAARLGILASEESKQQPITHEEARRRRRAAVNTLWARLAEEYPAVIAPQNHAPRHPLKIGVDRDIREQCPDVSLRTRDEFLRLYVGQPRYLHLLTKPGAVRLGSRRQPNRHHHRGSSTERSRAAGAARGAQ